MIKKFVSIKNVGTFRNSAAPGNTELKKLTLVHAENGRGKTTLCAILRSFQSGDANLILERKTLDGDSAPSVNVLLDSGLVTFKDGAWTSQFSSLEIFDAGFVADNVYSGDTISHDHKKNLCRVVIGAEGVVLAKKFDDFDGQVRTANTDLTTAKGAVEKLVPRGFAVERFISLVEDVQIDQKISAKKAEIDVLAAAEPIKQKSLLAQLILPEPPATLTAILQKTIDGVSTDAETSVRDHIDAHRMGGRGEAWIAEGLQYVTGGDCPLCGQNMSASDLIQTFKAFFSASYRSFKQELSRFEASVAQPLSDNALLTVQGTITGNAALVEFWKKYVPATPPSLSFDERIVPVIQRLREAIVPLVKKKLESPLEAVAYSSEANEAIEAWKKLRDEANAYNSLVTNFNAAIAVVKAASATKNSAALQNELSTLEAQKARFTTATVTAIRSYAEAKAKKTAAEQAKDKAKVDLDAYNAKVIGKYRDTVNKLLTQFGAKFTLAQVKMEYMGRTPRTAYTFEIRGKEVDPGGDNTPPGTACFRNTLSSGDRNTLALAFFIAQLKNRSDLGDLVVVFDDPFTSLDSFRQNWTCNTIRSLGSQAKQVIVLSHSLAFLKLLASGCEKTSLKALQIDRQGKIDSHIIELDLDDANLSAVEKDVVKLKSFYDGDDNDSRGAIRTIRPLLENYLRKMAPDQCPVNGGWLGTFLGEINKADTSSPLAALKSIYDELDTLNRYTSPHAHDSGKEPAIDNVELHSQAGLTLTLIGRL